MNKTFSPEVRAQACARVLAGERPTAVARDVGVAVNTLRTWRIASGQATSSHARAPSGQLLPGHTANPSGSTTHIERAQRTLEEAAPRLAEGLRDLALEMLAESDPTKVRLLADKVHALSKLGGGLLDRVLGKPAQRIEVKADTPLDADRLAALRAKLSPASPPAKPQGEEG